MSFAPPRLTVVVKRLPLDTDLKKAQKLGTYRLELPVTDDALAKLWDTLRTDPKWAEQWKNGAKLQFLDGTREASSKYGATAPFELLQSDRNWNNLWTTIRRDPKIKQVDAVFWEADCRPRCGLAGCY